MTPFEAAEYLDAASAASLKLIEEASSLAPASEKEFQCISLDVEAVAALGRYYAERILSAAHLALYMESSHHPELMLAHKHLKSAASHWDRLSDVTEQHFAYVPELIRMRVYDFRWRDEGRFLGVALEDIDRMEAEFQRTSHRRLTAIGHVPPERLAPGKPFTVVATQVSAPFDAKMHLFYRTASHAGYERAPMALLDQFARTWSAELPASVIVPGTLEYYFESYEGISGSYGSTLESRQPYTVHVTRATAKPRIAHTSPGNTRGKAVMLRARISGVESPGPVRVYYKRMPAWHEWLPVEMKPVAGGEYEASVPLTPEGILYYFEAESGAGSATRYPDFLRETPYFVIDSWDAAN